MRATGRTASNRRQGHCRSCWRMVLEAREGTSPAKPSATTPTAPASHSEAAYEREVAPPASEPGNGEHEGVSGPEVMGGMAFRYWWGTPGRSPFISGSAFWYEVIEPGDVGTFTGELERGAQERIRRTYWEQTGLLLSSEHTDLTRIEWLWIWEPGQDTQIRLKAFESGLSKMRPVGVQPHKLTSLDLGAIARRAGAYRYRTPEEHTGV